VAEDFQRPDERTTASAHPPGDDGSGVGQRRGLSHGIHGAASLIALGSILATWVHRQMLDNQSWKDASAKLIADPKVQNALSVYLVNELYDNVNVASGLEQRLPANPKPLAAPVAAALRQPATDGVKRLLEGPRVQQLWIDASAATQEKAVNVLENKTAMGSLRQLGRHAGPERAGERDRD
jgi:hypothetical protein